VIYPTLAKGGEGGFDDSNKEEKREKDFIDKYI
jgi:hypothetical protein